MKFGLAHGVQHCLKKFWVFAIGCDQCVLFIRVVLLVSSWGVVHGDSGTFEFLFGRNFLFLVKHSADARLLGRVLLVDFLVLSETCFHSLFKLCFVGVLEVQRAGFVLLPVEVHFIGRNIHLTVRAPDWIVGRVWQRQGCLSSLD